MLTRNNMGCNVSNMGSSAVERGAVAEAVAANVRAVRERRGMSQQQLAARMGDLGRPIQASTVAKVESGSRRVDVDDLAALAVALNVPLARLMVPDVELDESVFVVPAVPVPAWIAWGWANGEQSLHPDDEPWNDPSRLAREQDFFAERPLWRRAQDDHDLAKAARHVGWLVSKVLRAPAEHKTPKTRAAAAQAWLSKLDEALVAVRHSAELVGEEIRRG